MVLVKAKSSPESVEYLNKKVKVSMWANQYGRLKPPKFQTSFETRHEK